MNTKSSLLFKSLVGGILILILCLLLPASAGIPEPPMIIVGKLEIASGLQVTSGNLQIRFTPTGGGTTIPFDAVVGSYGSEYSYYAIVPLESPLNGEVSTGTLRVDGSTTYSVSIRYEGDTVSSDIPSPFTPERAGLVEPSPIVVQPEGASLAASPGIHFGYVPVGSSEDEEFLVWNVGDATLTGTIRLSDETHFSLLESGSPVNEVTINLAPGESLSVTVHLEPTEEDSTLSSTLEIRTNGGDEDRSVYGNSAAPIQPYNCDIDGNGCVDNMDLLIIFQNWQREPETLLDTRTDFDQDKDCDEADLLLFLSEWHSEG